MFFIIYMKETERVSNKQKKRNKASPKREHVAVEKLNCVSDVPSFL
jgi:hypothetical protein